MAASLPQNSALNVDSVSPGDPQEAHAARPPKLVADLSGPHHRRGSVSLHTDADLESNIKDQLAAKATWSATLALAYRSIGIIYGDIGTSPLYVYASTFTSSPSQDDVVVGPCLLSQTQATCSWLASLIFWTITLVVVGKYILLVLMADDHGEGGTFALYSLIARYAHISTPSGGSPNSSDLHLSRYTSNSMLENSQRHRPKSVAERAGHMLRQSGFARLLLLMLVLLATSMIIGDGVLTPAISVISAISGIEQASPNITNSTIVGVTCAILVLLFAGQRFGTSKVGFTFAPIVIVWFTANVMVNLYNIIVYYPGIFKALSPHYLFLFFIRNGFSGWVALGGTLLCVTGSEALYADLGHFSKTAIRLGFLTVAYPSLVITYLGQAAYLMVNPDNYATTFYSCIPSPVYWPVFVVAVLAAIVASQAMISGAFSIVRQSINLGCFPRLNIRHTSEKFAGQIYIPAVNWTLMVLSIAVVAGFQSSTAIGNGYGVAVTFVFLITTNLFFLASMVVFNINPLYTWPIYALFLLIDGAYLSANLFKFLTGGWFPIALSAVVFLISSIWFYGRQRKSEYSKEHAQYLESVLHLPDSGASDGDAGKAATLGGSRVPLTVAGTEEALVRVPGVALLFSDTVTEVPAVFTHMLRNLPAMYETVILVTVRFVPVSRVLPEERFLFRPLSNAPGFHRAVARYGYQDRVDLGWGFAETLMRKMAAAVTPLGVSPPETQDSKIVYIMGNTSCEPKPDSPCVRRMILEYGYNPLAAVTRSRNAAWNVPKARLIEFGLVFEV